MDAETAQDAAFIPGTSPFRVSGADGAYLVTPEGRRILDAGGGALVTNIGHGRAEVAEVAARAIRKVTYIVPTFMSEERVQLVERLRSSWLPRGLTQCLFVSGGSESVDVALRLARLHHFYSGRPERWKVIGTDLSYHGTTLAGLSVSGHPARRRGLEPLLVSMPKTPAPYSLKGALGHGSVDPRDSALESLERVIAEAGPESVAAFICEPVAGSAGGANVPPPGWWPGVVEICRRHGILVIADEVMAGFGRTGKRFAVEHWDVVPDILVGGKGLAGGYAAMGGVFTSEAIVEPLARAGEDLMFYTYDAQPAACAVADKVLEIMERESLVDRVARMGDLLKARLEEEFGDHPNVAQVRGLGLLLGLELVHDRDSLEKFPAQERVGAAVTAAGLERGIWVYPGGTAPAHDTVLLGPPFIIEGADIDLLVGALHESIDVAVGR
ncbi:MAG TPA: aminotransferase class III-fold pyridoxal phosphate-dependent enzyme [Dehalococcoidia bacterium]|nr:aminotransferase class III-fold pyridoxal phosphate-dependent enzyme [Dehalococcoidia bacterium]